MRTVKISLIAMLLCVLTFCEKSGFTEAERSRVTKEVREMLQNYDDDVRNNGLMAEFAYLDSSDEFFWAPPGYSSSLSFDSVAVLIKSNARRFRTVDNTWTSLRIIPLSGSLATFTGTIASTMTDTTGTVTRVSLLETGIAIKRPEGWKMLSGQTALLQ